MFKCMGEINLEFVDRTEELNEVKYIQKLMEEWSFLNNDSSVNYLEPLDDVGILDPSQISLTFKYEYDLIENE